MSNDGKDYSEMSALAVLKENTGLRAQLLAAFDDCEEQSARIETRDSLIQQLHADVADLRAQLAEWKARCERRVADIHEASKRYELVLEQLRAANQRIEEAEKQEPVGEVTVIDKHDQSYCMSALGKIPFGTKLYTRPIPPADVADK